MFSAINRGKQNDRSIELLTCTNTSSPVTSFAFIFQSGMSMLIYLVIDLAAGAMGILDQQVDKKSAGRDLPIS